MSGDDLVTDQAYLVIVHAAGLLEEEPGGYWSEVPALAACMSEGETVDAVVANTRTSIAAWLSRDGGPAGPVDVQVRLAL